MATEIQRKHRLGTTIQNSSYGQGHTWLFEGEGDPATGTAQEIQNLNDINAPIGSKFLDLVEGVSYTKIDSTPNEERGAYKVGTWKLSGGSGISDIDEAVSTDFSPVDAGGTRYLIDSASDIYVTINEDSCLIGSDIEFKQLGTGQIILTSGDITFSADIYTSVKTAGTGSVISVFHDKLGMYSISGQTE